MAESPSSPAAQRPLSPHLQVYRPQLTSGMSIFHRFTGIGLAGGVTLLVAWLVCLAWLPDFYPLFMSLLTSIIGKIFLFGWTWAFFYHLSTGIRHLLWDAGWGLSLKGIYTSGYIALTISTLLTLGLWIIVLGHGVVSWL